MMGKTKIKFAVLAGRFDLSFESGFIFSHILYAGKGDKKRSVGYGHTLDSTIMRTLWYLKDNVDYIKNPTNNEIAKEQFVGALEQIQLIDFLIPYLYLVEGMGRYEID